MAELVHYRNEETEGDECTRWQYEEQYVVCLGQQGYSEHCASAQDLTHNAQKSQCHGEAQSYTDAVEKACYGTLLGCEGLSTSEDDTVHNNQGNEESQGSVNVGQESLDDKLQDGDKGSNHYDKREDYS